MRRGISRVKASYAARCAGVWEFGCGGERSVWELRWTCVSGREFEAKVVERRQGQNT